MPVPRGIIAPVIAVEQHRVQVAQVAAHVLGQARIHYHVSEGMVAKRAVQAEGRQGIGVLGAYQPILDLDL